MAVDIKNLIAAINPKLYCEHYTEEYGEVVDLHDRVEKIAKEKGYIAAAAKAKLRSSDPIDFDEVILKNPFSNPGQKNPVEKHSLVYDAFGESLEPLYFWIVDNLQTEYKDMDTITKLVDNFASSPGSGHFSEMGMRATKMQEESIKLLVSANQIIKSILNIIYDLKEFKLRLKLYEKLKSEKKEEKESATLALKQIWMDTVDIKRGNTAIKLMAQQFQYVTLIDAFMSLKSLEDLKSQKENKNALDLNDRVRRILLPRYSEFLDWLEESEKELKKRFEIEKIYLKSQVDSIKLYARWAKPYLQAARKLEQNASSNLNALVSTFNTAVFELILLGESKYKPEDDVKKGDLPSVVVKTKTKYVPIIIIELRFRSSPERTNQGGYSHRGKVGIDFTGVALSDIELKILKKEIEKDDFGEVFKSIEGVTEDSLMKIQSDIDELLGDKKDEEEKKDEEDTNPFSALISFFKSEKKEEKKSDEDEKPGKENDIEKALRSQAIIKARQECQKFYELYKKAHSMANL